MDGDSLQSTPNQQSPPLPSLLFVEQLLHGPLLMHHRLEVEWRVGGGKGEFAYNRTLCVCVCNCFCLYPPWQLHPLITKQSKGNG